MNKNKFIQAMEYLEHNPLLHTGILEPMKHNQVEILYGEKDGVFLKDLNSGAYMVSMENMNTVTDLLEHIQQGDLWMTIQEEAAEEIIKFFPTLSVHPCYQAIYNLDKNIPVSQNSPELEIIPLTIKDLDIVLEHYQLVPQKEIEKHLQRQDLYGGYLDHTMVGFIGRHFEGSMGLLEIFPEFRGRGFATSLIEFMIKQSRIEGRVPFSQIWLDNEISISLHKKLGFTLLQEKIYWIF